MVNHHQRVVAIAAALAAMVAATPSPIAEAIRFSKETVSKCQEKWQVSEEIIEEMQRNKGALPNEDSVEQRCFAECVAKEMGVINNGGGVAVDKIVKILEAVFEMASKETGEKLKLDSRALKRDLEACEFKGEDDECTNSYDTLKCLRTLGTSENMRLYVTKES
uniref:Odorant-binding protein 15 n=1 Tax=Oedaleus infernalis TaxID=267432 RepID=A0A385I8D2_9ORTH|nr:odorant-binding protein 15 [Oedaleus infernalis]